jgi:Reverse transcriptase (RNA-dependent DNA polymerase)
VSAADVYSKLQQIKGNASAGPDGIQAVVLKGCAAALAPSLSRLFNCSLQQGALPQGWKTAAVAPIPKGGEKSDLENYRPISMTSLVGKALEKLVRDRIQIFMEENKIIPDCQHGFRAKRSCTTHLTKTLDRWASILDQKSGAHVHAITLDWKKAFDRVPHGRLLDKLSHYGINGTLLKWVKSFLKGRTQFVAYNGAKSESREVKSGVIQGSCLGPLLFIIFAADLPPMVSSNIILYADDVVVDRTIFSSADVTQLQNDLDGITVWGAINGMELNASKCHVLDITRARTQLHAEYFVSGAALSYKSTERILGVHVSSDLKWNENTERARCKASKVLSFAARNLYGCTPRVKRLAYQTMVKPLLFYATPAWHPSTQINVEKFEKVQKRALRFVYGRHIPEESKTQLLTVRQQLKYNDLTFFRKCLDGHTDMDAMARITTGRTMRNSNGEHRLIPPRARTDLGLHSFSFRLATQWNSLPSELKFCPASHFPKLCRANVLLG